MNIINIDSTIMLTSTQLAFCEEVISFGEEQPRYDEDNLLILLKSLPIFLVSEATFQKEDFANDEEGESDMPSTEWLGYYTRKTNSFMNRTQIIVLCPERIRSIVKTDEEFTIIFTKVLIHELAHAKMDFLDKSKDYGVKDEFYKWLEEGFANAITLETFENYERGYSHYHSSHHIMPISMISNSLEVVKSFIQRQPINYRFGKVLFDYRFRIWWKWARYKDEFGINATPHKIVIKEQLLHEMKGCQDKTRLKNLFIEICS